jgi:FemAB family protein
MEDIACYRTGGEEARLWEEISKHFTQAGFSVVRRDKTEHGWSRVLAEMDYVPIWYTLGMNSYQHSYHKPLAEIYFIFDLVLLHQGTELAIWPWTAFRLNGKSALSSHHAANQAVLPPRFVARAGDQVQKKICKLAVEVLNYIAAYLKMPSWSASYSPNSIQLPEWHRAMMNKGAEVIVNHELWVNLDLSYEEIRAGYRKSFKSLINSGMRRWKIVVDEAGNLDSFSEFRRLHALAAARITRGEETWGRQFEAVQAREAMAVYAYVDDTRLVGAGLIYLSRDEAFYGVGAFDRTMFDEPLAHIVIHTAVCRAKERGCRRFFVGDRAYSGDPETPDDKGLNLAYFKEGFASYISPRFTQTVKEP